MPPWWIKAFVQRGIGALPFAPRWNELFQQHVTRSLDWDDAGFAVQLAKCRRHLDCHRRHARDGSTVPGRVLELGTGWHGLFPVAMVLAGVESVWTWDVARLLRSRRLRAVVDRLVRLADRGMLTEVFPEAVPERVDRLARFTRARWTDPYGALPDLGIHARVGDARTTGLPDGSIDLISSTVVLEYIPRPELVALFREFRRVAAPGGVMSHEVDLMDQYAFFDPTIGPFHFLGFSDRAWRWINNPLTPLSRLRIPDFRACLAETGFELVEESATRGDPAELARIDLAPRFRAYDREDLLVVDAWLVARPRG